MKKIILSLIAVMACMSISAQVIKVYKNDSTTPEDTYTNTATDKYKVVFEEAPATTGTAKATLTVGSSAETDVRWVQLWKDGPKFATINVGATITDYASATTYNEANVGGGYSWGGSTSKGILDTCDDYNTGAAVLTDNNDTATKLWGSNWRMPTQAEFNKLANYSDDGSDKLATDVTTWTWYDGSTTQYVSGCTLAGYKVSGVGDYADNSVFLPATFSGFSGAYWSSTPGDTPGGTGDYNDCGIAYNLSTLSSGKGVVGNPRFNCMSVRAVLK